MIEAVDDDILDARYVLFKHAVVRYHDQPYLIVKYSNLNVFIIIQILTHQLWNGRVARNAYSRLIVIAH